MPMLQTAHAGLTLAELQLLLFDSWYHDFEALGFKTGISHPKQRCKRKFLFQYITGQSLLAGMRQKI